mmetsp:Transcript_40605/g.96165  ORF Transcript_40605/g.96165 Transcript_40605/m.96165 type:complete len:200 (-) Transcript_40605:19-618(-)
MNTSGLSAWEARLSPLAFFTAEHSLLNFHFAVENSRIALIASMPWTWNSSTTSASCENVDTFSTFATHTGRRSSIHSGVTRRWSIECPVARPRGTVKQSSRKRSACAALRGTTGGKAVRNCESAAWRRGDNGRRDSSRLMMRSRSVKSAERVARGAGHTVASVGAGRNRSVPCLKRAWEWSPSYIERLMLTSLSTSTPK